MLKPLHPQTTNDRCAELPSRWPAGLEDEVRRLIQESIASLGAEVDEYDGLESLK